MIETDEFAGFSVDSRSLAGRRERRRVVFLALAAGALLFSLVAAQGTTITVNSDADAGGICPGATCTLRQAILTAAPGNTINFAGGITTISLTSAELAINKDLTITGPGANLLTVQRSTASGTPKFRIFHIAVGNLTMSGLTIANGNADSGVSGGGISNSSGTLTVESCIIFRNIGGDGCGGGGGLFNSSGGTVNITNSTLASNDGGATSAGCGGGGVLNSSGGMVNITTSTLSGNVGGEFDGNISGGGGGGGIRNNGGTVTILNSTISGNDGGVEGGGGGIFNSSGGVVNMTNSTVSGNRGFGFTESAGGAGGIRNTDGTVTITNSTITGNSSPGPGGVSNEGAGTINARNSIIAMNTRPAGPSDFAGTLTSEGYNLIGNTSGTTITGTTTGNQLNVDPNLGPLQDNGGPTFTHALLSGSTAIDGGDSSGSNSDQRGLARPVDDPSIANATGGDAGVLADPLLELRGPTGSLIASNDNWKDNPDQALLIQASGIPPQDDLESAIVATLSPAGYTAIVSGKSNGTGLGLVEVYDLDQSSDSNLANISTRAFVETGNNVVIGGFILGGPDGSATIIIRAIGPSLAQLGITNPLADPTLELRDGNGMLLAFDDNWKDNPAQAAQVSAAGLQPRNDLEAAIAATLPAGNYTGIVAGKNGGSGVGLVEVYNLQ
jgi:hypothetical protein